jgi:acetyl-CoA carboxylase biotin carboxyl carrier protein
MTISEIQDLIKFVSKSGVSEVEIEQKDFKITIKTEVARKKNGPDAPQVIYAPAPALPAAPAPAAAAPAPAPAAPAAPASPAAPAPAAASNLITVKSPMIGTFYRRSSPDKPLLADVGTSVKPGSVLCIIEAMKLFNEIECEVSGKIVSILVDDNSPVEYDQPLFLVEPA